jgi:hypothetical protein
MVLDSIALDTEATLVGSQQWQSPQTDALLADATAHLVEAYEAIDELSRTSSLLTGSPTFLTASRCLCVTLAAMDEFSESAWARILSSVLISAEMREPKIPQCTEDKCRVSPRSGGRRRIGRAHHEQHSNNRSYLRHRWWAAVRLMA